MSSTYSSVRTSIRPSRTGSPSSFAPAEYQHVDLDTLFRKLDKYQSRLERAEARFSRQRSSSPKEVKDVVASMPFRFDLEKLQQRDCEDEENAHVPGRTAMPPPRKSSMHPKAAVRKSSEPLPAFVENFERPRARLLKNRISRRPEPIVVPANEAMPQEVQSATLPPRTLSRPSDPQAFMKTHRRHITISEGRGSARNVVLMSSPSFSGAHTEHELPPLPSFPEFILPALSPSSSVTTAQFSNPPATPLFLCPPNEDQIRREIELFTLHDGGESLVGNQFKHRAPPNLVLDFDEDEIKQDYREALKPRRAPVGDDDARSMKSTKSVSSMKSLSRRRKSIFAAFQRKSEVDKLLDLYLGDDEPEKPMKRRQSLAKRMTRSRRDSNHEKQPEMPPLPPMPLIGSYRPG